ncbi:MAG: hypothetical protein BroJett038_21870 [Chloroflexota bacterium]|nr:MAG: hypothetical protein BroJett038_21870 [Chloroflexota bacterium]
MNGMISATEITPKDLPDWMRLARRDVDWGLLLVIAISLLAGWPFIAQPTLPHTNASENYVYATADFAAAFREGQLYPRWSPNVFGGYGAPIPNFYPPGATYAAALLQVLFTDDAALAVRLVYILSFCLAGSTAYVLVARRAGASAGVLAAFLYLYSPYLILTAPHILGDLPAVAGMALLTILLWSADRLLLRDHPADMLFAALAAAGLFLTDVRIGLAGALLVLALLPGGRKKAVFRIFASIVLGVGMAACYWLPALLEQNAVSWQPPRLPAAYRLTLPELLAPASQIDPNEMTPLPQLRLGLPLVLLMLPGAAAAVRYKLAFQAAFLAAGAALILAALALFPHEIGLLGPITLCLSIGGSAALRLRDELPPRRRRLLLPILLIAAWILAAPVWLLPYTNEPFGSADAPTQIQYEQLGYGIPVLPAHLPVPATISASLQPNRSLIEGYLSGAMNKIALASTSDAQVRVGILEHHTHSDRFQVSASGPVTLNVLTAYFPGWQATLNGRPVSVWPASDTGLLNVSIPPVREGQLVVAFGSTPERETAWVITWAALAITLIITWGRFRRHKITYDDMEQLSRPEARLLALVFSCFIIITPLAALPDPLLPLRLQPGHGMDGAIPASIRTDGGLSLLSYRVQQAVVHPGDSLDLTLYWAAQRFLPKNYSVLLYLLNTSDGTRWNEVPLHYPGSYPTRRWNTSRYASDHYHLALDPAMPFGDYRIVLEVYDCSPDCRPQNRLNFFDPAGRILGPVLSLPLPITVRG